MGEYTTRVRFEDPRPLIGYVSGQDPQHDFHRSADYTYSWRSRRTNLDLDDRSAGTVVGIKLPKQTGSLLDIVADRQRFNEDIAITASTPDVPTFGQSCSTMDKGHRFTSVKYRSLQEGQSVWYRNGVRYYVEPIVAFPSAFVLPEMSIPTLVFPTSQLPSAIAAPPKLERQARLNGTFNSMNPLDSTAKIGETIVSLIRGDVPRIFKGIVETMTALQRLQLKKTANGVGGEFLSSTFGWQPLIADIENCFKVLLAIDHLIFGVSYRRQRSINFNTAFHTAALGRNVSAGSSYRPSRVGYHGASVSVFPQVFYQSEPAVNYTRTADIRMSARMGAIARPTRGANAFIDQVEDKLHDLGIWYPALGWDLLPFSWLVDWFTSLGSSLTNAMYYGKAPGKVNLDYAWATTCITVLGDMSFKYRTYADGTNNFKLSGHPRSMSVVKVREGATPYGFGLDFSSLSAGQVSILVALGLAKA